MGKRTFTREELSQITRKFPDLDAAKLRGAELTEAEIKACLTADRAPAVLRKIDGGRHLCE